MMLILGWALVNKDFRFTYVAEYSSSLLPWHYSLSALWVGQAGSLLLWAWLCSVLGLAYWIRARRTDQEEADPTFGILMGYVCFLVTIMVFAADPMERSLAVPRDGAGLSPLLQHPAMLIHPPVVFLGYSLWTIPFALAAVALLTDRLNLEWVRQARPWALAAWAVLGAGILLGAQWSYEELGWGGYWSWDPVENGSLIPWLTGTALIHALMCWQYCGTLKRTALSLAIATFGLCNFATFLTRSGIFSSLHAFSKSPIGWLFLLLMIVLSVGGGILLVRRKQHLLPERPIQNLASREAAIILSTVALFLLTTVVIVGTISTAVSKIVLGRFVMVGPAFYNNVLIPTGLILLATTAIAPLLRWTASPTAAQWRALAVSALSGAIASVVSIVLGIRHPLEAVVIGLAVLCVVALLAAIQIDVQRRRSRNLFTGIATAFRSSHAQYAGFLIHLGFVAIALGVTGSSLGTHQQEVLLAEGERIEWAGHNLRLARIGQRTEPDKLIGNVELEVSRQGSVVGILRPAKHYHLLQKQWTTEVDVHSTWTTDIYTILHDVEGTNQARLTLVENPMMRWLWLGGWIMGLATVIRLLPLRRRATRLSLKPAKRPRSANMPATRAAAALLLAVTFGFL
jgi:cytochrome c-type biogenesis protein CcmF